MTQLLVDTVKMRYRDDAKNLTLPPLKAQRNGKREYQASPSLGTILTRLKTALAITLEYEHTLALIYGKGGRVHVHYLELPHPSGIFFDGENLIVSSTRSPNQIIYFRVFPKEYKPETVNRVLGNLRSATSKGRKSRLEAPLLLPVKSLFLPGQFSVHDVVKIKNDIYVTVTGLNFVARVLPDGGFERVWNPKCVDRLGKKAFTTNYLQLNSIARGKTIKECFFTAFSDQPTQEKPWKLGYGPKNKGVVFEGRSRETVYRGLTCPHSIRKKGGELWLCDSGMGELGTFDPYRGQYTPVTKVQGFTRGLAFLEHYAVLGLSKVIPSYEPYAPGLDAKKSQCGIVFVNLKTGKPEASLIWKDGFQIYDVQTLDGIERVLLPENSDEELMNYYLTYYGWDRKWKYRKTI